jgi:hypothetical protein
MTLDQLSAFAITEDHERQERMWHELPPFNCSRPAILRALSEGQVESDGRDTKPALPFARPSRRCVAFDPRRQAVFFFW